VIVYRLKGSVKPIPFSEGWYSAQMMIILLFKLNAVPLRHYKTFRERIWVDSFLQVMVKNGEVKQYGYTKET
jgi:hypothetical protein